MTIRPDRGTVRAFLIASLVAVLPLLILQLVLILLHHPSSQLWFCAVLAGIIAIGIWTTRSPHVQYLRLTQSHIVYRNRLGLTRRARRDQVAEILITDLDTSTAVTRGRSLPYLVFINREHRCCLRVMAVAFAEADRLAFANNVGVQVHVSQQAEHPRRIRAEIPGAAPWVYAHPWLEALAVLPGILALILVLAWLFPTSR